MEADKQLFVNLVPAYCNLPENELANILAELSSSMIQINVPADDSQCRPLFRQVCRSLFRQECRSLVRQECCPPLEHSRLKEVYTTAQMKV